VIVRYLPQDIPALADPLAEGKKEPEELHPEASGATLIAFIAQWRWDGKGKCMWPGSPFSAASKGSTVMSCCFAPRLPTRLLGAPTAHWPHTQLLSNCLLSIGLDDLVAGKKAFVNFDRELLLAVWRPSCRRKLSFSKFWSLWNRIVRWLLPAQGFAVWVMKSRSTISFMGCAMHPSIPFISMIKVDFLSTDREDREHLVRTYQPLGIKMLAEKVETKEEFEWAWKAGYDFFQGYFFCPAPPSFADNKSRWRR